MALTTAVSCCVSFHLPLRRSVFAVPVTGQNGELLGVLCAEMPSTNPITASAAASAMSTFMQHSGAAETLQQVSYRCMFACVLLLCSCWRC